MKKYASLNFVLAFLLLSAPLTWGCGNESGCHQQDIEERQQLVPGDPAPRQSQPKLRTRGFAVSEETGVQVREEAPSAEDATRAELAIKTPPQQGK